MFDEIELKLVEKESEKAYVVSYFGLQPMFML